MATKHFLPNDTAELVKESLNGLQLVNPALHVDLKHKVVALKDRKEQVALISGGGSGHEPAHAGFVGDGMLTAAVCGNIFASPNPGQVQRALELVQNPKGTVIIVKNYTGDILNFGLAKELYSTAHPSQAALLRFVVVSDDVAIGRTQGAIVGRRGLAGTVLVYKIAGALARRGGELDQVEGLAKLVAARVATLGVGLGHCHVPGTEGGSNLKENEYELGMGKFSRAQVTVVALTLIPGIHNEPGYRRSSPIPPLPGLMEGMIEMLVSTADEERSFLPFRHDRQDEVVLMVNNLGGVSELELSAVAGAAVLELRRRGLKIERVLAGTFMTSLNMPGISLTLLLLPRVDEGTKYSAKEILSYLDDSPDVASWKSAANVSLPSTFQQDASLSSPLGPTKPQREVDAVHISIHPPSQFVGALKRACEAVIRSEPEITRMDQIGGDGDCGFTLRNGAQAILERIDYGGIKGEDLMGDVRAIARAVGERMDGTSGALYSIFFSALAQALYDISADKEIQANVEVAAQVLSKALERLYTYTRARPPSRTLVDPLAAFITALKEKGSWKVAVEHARKAAKETKDLPAKAGRAAYVEQNHLKDTPDPGAWGVKVILEAACEGLE